MKLSIIPMVAAFALMSGCSEPPAAKDNASLQNFLQLHSQFCEAEHKTQTDLVTALNKDSKFKTMASHDGIFERVIADVSYAVTPEAEGCTTDLKLKEKESDSSYFDFDELNVALINKGYRVVGEKKTSQEVGLNSSELSVIEQKYLSPRNIESTLVFPVEKQDQYFMTFYAEKFQYREATAEKTNSNLYEI